MAKKKLRLAQKAPRTPNIETEQPGNQREHESINQND